MNISGLEHSSITPTRSFANDFPLPIFAQEVTIFENFIHPFSSSTNTDQNTFSNFISFTFAEESNISKSAKFILDCIVSRPSSVIPFYAKICFMLHLEQLQTDQTTTLFKTVLVNMLEEICKQYLKQISSEEQATQTITSISAIMMFIGELYSVSMIQEELLISFVTELLESKEVLLPEKVRVLVSLMSTIKDSLDDHSTLISVVLEKFKQISAASYDSEILQSVAELINQWQIEDEQSDDAFEATSAFTISTSSTNSITEEHSIHETSEDEEELTNPIEKPNLKRVFGKTLKFSPSNSSLRKCTHKEKFYHPNRVLLHDYYSRDLCLIHLDSIIESIIVNCDENNKICFDFQKELGFDYELHCGSFLHFVHLFETKLKQLKEEYVNIRIMAFPNSPCHLQCKYSNLFYLCRQILIHHIQQADLCQYVIFTSNWFHESEYTTYVIKERPAFVVAPKYDELFIAQTMINANSVVVVDIHKRSSGLYGYELVPKHSKAVIAKHTLLKSIIWNNSPLIPFHCMVPSKMKLCASILLTLLHNENGIISISKLHYAQIVYATIVLQQSCSLTERALIQVDFHFPELNSFLNQFYSECMNHFEILSQTFAQEELLDIIDGRLCHYLLSKIEPVENEQTFALPVGNLNESVGEFFDAILQLRIVVEEKVVQNNPAKENIIVEEETFEELLGLVPEKQSTKMESHSLYKPIGVATNYLYNCTNSLQLCKLNCELLKRPELRINGLKEVHVKHSSNSIHNGLFKDIFHYHSSKLLDNTEEGKEKLRELAKHFLKTKRLISTFPQVNLNEPKKLLALSLEGKLIDQVTFKNQVKQFEATTESDALQFSKRIQEQINYLEVKHLQTAEQSLEQYILFLYSKQVDLFLQIVTISMKIEDLEKRVWKVMNWIFFIHSFATMYQKRLQNVQAIHSKLLQWMINLKMNHTASLYAKKYRLVLPSVNNHTDCFNFQSIHIKCTVAFGDPTPPTQDYNNYKFNMVKEFTEMYHQRLAANSSQPLKKAEELRQILIARNIRFDFTFVPDKWQIELIHHLDSCKSTLVSAPTSSGKTFITTYLIEKVLWESDDGVVVFIVPTNALVNQVYCELYAQLSKKYSAQQQDQNEDTTIGVFTKTLRFNENNCQVLVSIPQMFQHILFSQTPSNLEFKKRLKYLILDEVHSMSDPENGKIWEQIILMTNAPILALSATLGDAEKFKTWLQLIRKSKVELISVNHRSVPLNYLFYDLKGFQRLHPLASLNPYQIIEKEVNQIPVLTLKEAYEYLMACKDIFKQGENIFESYWSGNFFVNEVTIGNVIEKERVHQFLENLTEDIKSKCKDESFSSLLLKVFEKLRINVDKSYEQLPNMQTKRISDYYSRNLSNLVEALFSNKLLPTITFLFDRQSILKSVTALIKYIESSKSTITNLWYSLEDRMAARIEIEKSIAALKGKSIDECLINGLRKGIAAHYSALDPAYQKEVERLLKTQKIPLVFATSTLAMGVHYPIKSIVIGMHSSYLNQVVFNQCSGRAGRRGYEREGNVIFFAMSKQRMFRYLNSELPSIQGTEGLSPSFICKVLGSRSQKQQELEAAVLYHNISKIDKDKEMQQFDAEMAQKLMSPLIATTNYHEKYNFASQMKFLLRYHVEFLQREGYLNIYGQPLQLCGVVNNLFYTEPYNFLFAHFLTEGCIHDLIKQVKSNPTLYASKWKQQFKTCKKCTDDDLIIKELLTIFSYLFIRINESNPKKRLPPPCQEFKESAFNYNKRMIQNYSDSVYSASSLFSEKFDDLELPFSKISISNQQEYQLITKQELEAKSDSIASISLAAGLSGNISKQYVTQEHFSSTLSSRSFLNFSSMPLATFYESTTTCSAFVTYFFDTESYTNTFKKFEFLNTNEMEQVIDRFSSVMSTLYFALLNQQVLHRSDIFMKYLNNIVKFLKKMSDTEENYDSESEECTDSEEEEISSVKSDNNSSARPKLVNDAKANTVKQNLFNELLKSSPRVATTLLTSSSATPYTEVPIATILSDKVLIDNVSDRHQNIDKKGKASQERTELNSTTVVVEESVVQTEDTIIDKICEKLNQDACVINDEGHQIENSIVETDELLIHKPCENFSEEYNAWINLCEKEYIERPQNPKFSKLKPKSIEKAKLLVSVQLTVDSVFESSAKQLSFKDSLVVLFTFLDKKRLKIATCALDCVFDSLDHFCSVSKDDGVVEICETKYKLDTESQQLELLIQFSLEIVLSLNTNFDEIKTYFMKKVHESSHSEVLLKHVQCSNLFDIVPAVQEVSEVQKPSFILETTKQILKELTKKNFKTQVEQLFDLKIRTIAVITKVVDEVYDFGLKNNSSQLCAQLCQEITLHCSWSINDERTLTSGQLFRKLLLNHCQKEYQDFKAGTRGTLRKSTKRSNLMKFIAELFIVGVTPISIIKIIIIDVIHMKESVLPNTVEVEIIVTVLVRIGHLIEHGSNIHASQEDIRNHDLFIKAVYSKLQLIATSEKTYSKALRSQVANIIKQRATYQKLSTLHTVPQQSLEVNASPIQSTETLLNNDTTKILSSVIHVYINDESPIPVILEWEDQLPMLIKALEHVDGIQTLLTLAKRNDILQIVIDLQRKPFVVFRDNTTHYFSEKPVSKSDLQLLQQLFDKSVTTRAFLQDTLHSFNFILNKKGENIGTTIEIGKDINGFYKVLQGIVSNPKNSVLIIGEAKVGKSTVIREIAKQFVSQNKSIAIIDTVGGIKGAKHSSSWTEKASWMTQNTSMQEMLLKCLFVYNPSVLFIDDVQHPTEKDTDAFLFAHSKGVQIIATSTCSWSRFDNLHKLCNSTTSCFNIAVEIGAENQWNIRTFSK